MQRRTVRWGSQPCSYGACGGQGRAGDNCVTAPGPATPSQSGQIDTQVPDALRQVPLTKPPFLVTRFLILFF